METLLPDVSALQATAPESYERRHHDMPKTKLEQELSEADYIYVLSAYGDPLMPTRRRGHVKRLLNKGKARIVSHVPFVIQLKYDGS